MKRYFLAAGICLAAMTEMTAAPAANPLDDNTEATDTVLNIKNVETVVITESANGVRLDAKGIDDDPQFQTTCDIPYDKDAVIKTHQSFKMPICLSIDRMNNMISFISGIHFGFTGATGAPAVMDTQMGKSFEIGIDKLIFYGYRFPESHRNMIVVGMGINWRNYRMTGEHRFDMVDGQAVVTDYPEGTDGKFSRIKEFSLCFPIEYWYRSPLKVIGKSSLAFKVSAILNWNSHASMLTQYNLADGTKVKENYDRIGQRKFTVDLQLGVMVAPSVSLYFKYTPFDFFKDGASTLKFQTISTGISLGF